MPDRLIRGESCCVCIATDRASVPPLNFSLHTGRKGMQQGEGGGSQAWGEQKSVGTKASTETWKDHGQQEIKTSEKRLENRGGGCPAGITKPGLVSMMQSKGPQGHRCPP